jgi:NADH-quinone oxidoreductase subunit L
MQEILIVGSIAIPWLGAVIIWLTGDQNSRLQHFFAVLFSVIAAGCSIGLLTDISSGTAISISFGSSYGNLTFVPDGLGVYLSIIATTIGALAVIFSLNYMHGEDQLGRYYSFVLFFIGAMVGLVLTSNLMFMFVFWEITALCSYVLISFYNDDPKAVRGGLKALIITQFGGLGLLLGAVLLFSYTGSFDINVFLSNPGAIPSSILAIMAFGGLIAAAAKSAQFPFQTWLPDAMEAPTPISALIHAATMVNAGVYLLVRFYPAFESVPGWRYAVMVIGMLSAFLAAIMALVSNDLKRVLAYSTVSQLGYMVYAIGAGGLFESQFHLLSHSVFKALLFLAAGAVIHSVGTRDMRKMGGLGKKLPFTRIVFLIGALALCGVPILNGFWSKELILEAGSQHGNPFWIYLIMLFVAGLTALYTLRTVWMVFYGEENSDLHVHPIGNAMKIALIPLAMGSLTTWLLVGNFGSILSRSLPAHKFHVFGLTEMVEEVISQPTTWIALTVVSLGFLTWFSRKPLSGLVVRLQFISKAAQSSFGFEYINEKIVSGFQGSADFLRNFQTGQLNWNIFGILTGLIVIIIVVLVGA